MNIETSQVCSFTIFCSGIDLAKKEGCSSLTSQTAKNVKKAKNKCLSAFSVCKKAEDEAVSLIHACMFGAVKILQT